MRSGWESGGCDVKKNAPAARSARYGNLPKPPPLMLPPKDCFCRANFHNLAHVAEIWNHVTNLEGFNLRWRECGVFHVRVSRCSFPISTTYIILLHS